MHSFTHEHLRKILQVAQAYRKRDWLMMLVQFMHGMRVSELIAIKRDDLEFGKKSFVAIQGLKKGLKATQELIEHSDELLNERKGLFEFSRNLAGNQRLFPITRQRFWAIVQQHGAAAGIPKHLCHPHTFRHTTAMEMLETAKLPEISKRLRHKSLSSLTPYTAVSDEQSSDAFGRAIGAKRD